jgi:hypothetical protein
MKTTKSQLKQIIKEEISKVLKEYSGPGGQYHHTDPLKTDVDPKKAEIIEMKVLKTLEVISGKVANGEVGPQNIHIDSLARELAEMMGEDPEVLVDVDVEDVKAVLHNPEMEKKFYDLGYNPESDDIGDLTLYINPRGA